MTLSVRAHVAHPPSLTVLVVGATGSIGRLVVEEALRQGHAVRALVAERGPATTDFDALFTALDADAAGALDAVREAQNMHLADEPARVREDLHNIGA